MAGIQRLPSAKKRISADDKNLQKSYTQPEQPDRIRLTLSLSEQSKERLTWLKEVTEAETDSELFRNMQRFYYDIIRHASAGNTLLLKKKNETDSVPMLLFTTRRFAETGAAPSSSKQGDRSRITLSLSQQSRDRLTWLKEITEAETDSELFRNMLRFYYDVISHELEGDTFLFKMKDEPAKQVFLFKRLPPVDVEQNPVRPSQNTSSTAKRHEI